MYLVQGRKKEEEVGRAARRMNVVDAIIWRATGCSELSMDLAICLSECKVRCSRLGADRTEVA